LVAIGMLDPGGRPGAWLALGLTLAIQAPLGYWLLVRVRSGSALTVWALGMLARAGLVGLMGLVLLPVLGWPLTPGLVMLVSLLMALLLLESGVLWWEHLRSEGS
jgi:hypothetical protein